MDKFLLLILVRAFSKGCPGRLRFAGKWNDTYLVMKPKQPVLPAQSATFSV